MQLLSTADTDLFIYVFKKFAVVYNEQNIVSLKQAQIQL